MLQISGKVLDVTSQTVNGPTGSFVSTTIHLLAGLVVEPVRLGRDYPPADVPKKDQDVTLNVEVSAYSSKAGARYNLSAMSRVHGQRIAQAS